MNREGAGTLTVTANCGNGVTSKDTLQIYDGVLSVQAAFCWRRTAGPCPSPPARPASIPSPWALTASSRRGPSSAWSGRSRAWSSLCRPTPATL
ncbi:MAG: carbohydrate-binding domain-containing protein [Lawsonibacter sp.]|nr:carbohydrate-binding domain-containing protein [Lawsonibacter sp.]